MSLVHFCRRIYFDGILYITNRIIGRIPSHTVRLLFYRKCMHFQIGTNSTVFMDAWFDTPGGLSIGHDSVINPKCHLDNRGGIRIGNFVSISSETIIITADHDLDSSYFEGRSNPVIIEDYVFIGTRAMILPGVTLGKGSAVAAGAVVTKSVDPFTIVGGVPAKPIRTRNHELEYNPKYDRLFS